MFRSKIIFNFIKRDLMTTLSYKAAAFGKFFSLIFIITIFYYLSLNNPENSKAYFSYLLIGLAYTAIIRTSIFELSSRIETEKLTGISAQLFSSPVSIVEYLIGSTSFGIFSSWIESSTYLLIGAIIFHAAISLEKLILIAFCILLSTISMWGIGLIAAAMTLITKKSSSISWILTMIIILSGDVFFSSNLLPKFFRIFAKINPARYSLILFRNLLGNNSQIDGSAYIFLIGFSIIIIPIGLVCFKSALNYAKSKGTLEHF